MATDRVGKQRDVGPGTGACEALRGVPLGEDVEHVRHRVVVTREYVAQPYHTALPGVPRVCAVDAATSARCLPSGSGVSPGRTVNRAAQWPWCTGRLTSVIEPGTALI